MHLMASEETLTLISTMEAFTNLRAQLQPCLSAHFLNSRNKRITYAILVQSAPTIAITVQVETVTLGKSTFYKWLILCDRTSNGGFYPAKTAAEFSNTYPSSLRFYHRARTPAEYIRPKTTK